MWGMTTYFNPARHESKYQNYKRFRESSKKQGLKLVCVELAFGDAPFELEKEDSDILVQLRSKSVMWQKERLLNIGLRHLPLDCDKVAWVDNDILFMNDHWVDEAGKLLEKHSVVQLFSKAYYGRRTETSFSEKHIDLTENYGYGEGKVGHGAAFRRVGSLEDYGTPGLAWAIRREILDAVGFYDRAIVGGGDHLFEYAMFGINHGPFMMSPAMQADYQDWARQVDRLIQKKVHYVSGFVAHQWHGDRKDRFHALRQQILTRFHFDPKADIYLNDNGSWEWKTNRKALPLFCAVYFWLRNENGNFIVEVVDFLVRKLAAAQFRFSHQKDLRRERRC